MPESLQIERLFHVHGVVGGEGGQCSEHFGKCPPNGGNVVKILGGLPADLRIGLMIWTKIDFDQKSLRVWTKIFEILDKSMKIFDQNL